MYCSRGLREETRVSNGKALDKSVGIEATKVNRTYRKTRRLDAALFLPEEDHAEHEAEACLT
ncbi:MC053.2 [Molluscum contagiosum virus subtype 1]|nr:MC053.2 [Molluscum contagiosum virus subtype 1]